MAKGSTGSATAGAEADGTPGPLAGTDGSGGESGGIRLYDMHCHLDFLDAPRAAADAAAKRGIVAFANTVTPRGYLSAREALNGSGNVRLGLGLHPWWVADGSLGEDDLALFDNLAASTPYIGEIGLDFAERRTGTFDAQAAAFERAVAARPDERRVFSIHTVRAAGAVLDILERKGRLRSGGSGESPCIFHWFSGSGDELTRAVRLGCYFSFGTRSLATKRGRAYVRAVPRDRLLLETDWPDDPGDGGYPDTASWVDAWDRELRRALGLMQAALRRPGAHAEPQADAEALLELAADLERNAGELLGL